MIKSILPFSLNQDKKFLIPNPNLFGPNMENIKFPNNQDPSVKIDIEKNSLDAVDRLNYIKLDNQYETTFWRSQHNNLSCLATIEAAFYCVREIKSKIPENCTNHILYN